MSFPRSSSKGSPVFLLPLLEGLRVSFPFRLRPLASRGDDGDAGSERLRPVRVPRECTSSEAEQGAGKTTAFRAELAWEGAGYASVRDFRTRARQRVHLATGQSGEV